MGKYQIGDYVETKHGVRKIIEIYPLNKIITVFKVIDVNGNKSEIFYGEIQYKISN